MDFDTLDAEITAFLWPEADAKLRRKRERILRAATDLFVAQGYRKTSVDEIARAAGVAKGTVYLYYRNKAELLYHAVALEEQAYLRQARPPSLDARDSLEWFVATGLEMSRSMPLTRGLLQGDREITIAIAELDVDMLEGITARELEITIELLDAATGNHWPRDRLEQRARALIELLTAVAASPIANRSGLPWDAYYRELAAVIIHGIAGEQDVAPLNLRSASGTRQ